MSESTEQPQRAVFGAVTESELIRGRNGKAIRNEWSKLDEPEDCSWKEIYRTYRIKSH